ncbi:hypothetical protein IEQ34_020893 [Dendrobium chrysotoxum]|uniref:tRNA (guanine-N(7)-)-methyltransferase non-catalytic subunit n=1 Tax=Dendrobium chrysotoxum TaxID=161865 RepID=A0AAV7G256_DENCH|nr:hypothetical protein IEQ34_020893 [Dendrobium chrysotoxum]
MEEEVHTGEINREAEAAPALIAVHPLDRSIALALGYELRVFDFEMDCAVSLTDEAYSPCHSDAIRAICFGANGRLFVSAGDDKLVKIWRTDTWHCIRTVCSDKRVSAVAISHDGLFVTFADKFGVVWIERLEEDDQGQASVDKKAVPLLGHYCSIITSLKFSPDGKFIATADRDFKIRITIFPKGPLKGAHEIQNFCLGHTDFVSCLTFICPPDCHQSFLLSGSGDATVRLWDHVSGQLLDTCDVGKKAGLLDSKEKVEDSLAVTDINALPDGSFVAAAIQGLHGVMILKCDVPARRLFIAKFVFVEESFVPTSLGLSSSSKLLWVVMGASNVSKLGVSKMAQLRVLSDLDKFLSNEHGDYPVILKDKDMPGGEKLLLKFQGSDHVTKQDEALAATATAVKVAMQNLLTKKQYSLEKRDFRKRDRNDRKFKKQQF